MDVTPVNNEHFEKNHIKIQNIFSNICGKCIFFLSYDEKVYRLIPDLQHVIDIKSTRPYCIVLCSTDDDTSLLIINN